MAGGLLWNRPVAHTRPRLTREAIVDAAISLADQEGLEAVSIRRVAAQLGARPMSLYSHIARKDDLLVLMSDQVAAEILVPEPLPADWRDALRAIAYRTRESCLNHPWVLTTLSQRLNYGPNAIRHLEQSAAAVTGLPVPSRRKISILHAVDTYTLGHTLAELRLRELLTHAETERAELRSYLGELIGGGGCPHLAQLGLGELPLVGEEMPHDFGEGLEWLLAGIAADLDSPTSPRSPEATTATTVGPVGPAPAVEHDAAPEPGDE